MDDEMILRKRLALLGGWLSGVMARFMPTDSHVVQFRTTTPLNRTSRIIYAKLYTFAEVLSTEDKEESFSALLVVGSGYGNLNPAVVRIKAVPSESGGSLVTVEGKAKEGLVKQRGGMASATAIAEELEQWLERVKN